MTAKQEIHANGMRFLVLLIIVVALGFIAMFKFKTYREEIKQQHFLSEVMNQSIDVEWVKDSKGRIIALSDSFEELFLLPYGLEKSDYIGKTDFEIFKSKIAKEFVRDDNYVKRLFKSENFINRIRHNGDSIVFYSVKFPYITGEGDTAVAGRGNFEIIK